MSFETPAQLANHIKRFCKDSSYHDVDRLNKKQMKLRSEANGGRGNEEFNLNRPYTKDKDRIDLDQVKGLLQSHKQKFAEEPRVPQKLREDNMEAQLEDYKQARFALRGQQRGDDVALGQLLNQYDRRPDLELQERIEQSRFQDALKDRTLNPDQRRGIEALQNRHGNLGMKESRFMDTVGDLIRREETPEMAHRKLQDLAIEEKSDRLKQLREQQQQLENERMRIMSNLNKNKQTNTDGLQFDSAFQRSQLGKAGASLIGSQKKLRTHSEQGNYGNGGGRGERSDFYGSTNQNNPSKMLEDLRRIRGDYLKAGGDNPGFLQNLDNLEKFYSNLKVQPNGYDYAKNDGLNKSFNNSISPATHWEGGRNSGLGNYPVNGMNGNNFNNNNNRTGSEIVNQLKNQADQLNNQNYQQKRLIELDQESAKLRRELEAFGRPNGQNMITPNAGIGFAGVPGVINPIDPFAQPGNNAVIFGKNGAPIIPTNQNNYTLSDINSKLHGYEEHGTNPFSIFTPQQEFLIQNEVRTVDLDDEERVIANLAKEEVDQLRILSRIPVGTELYRFKMEQFKELSTVKSEMEKIANEQKLQRTRMEFEYERREEDRQFDNEKWNDDQRKWILAQRIRKDLGPIGGMKQYDQNDGLVIHWDYILGLPKRTNFAQTVFGIFNKNDTLYPPKIVDPKECEVESAETVRCIIGDSHQIFDIPPNQDNLLIMEVQLPYSKKKGDTANKTESYGWTQLDLFDVKRELKRGKFKCPLYYPPTDQAISVHEIKHLEPIPGAWIYLRVAYPNDDDFSKQRSRYPEQTMHEYVIPYIHLRNDLGARQAYKMKPTNPDFPDGSQLPNMSYLPDRSQGDAMDPEEEEYIEQPPDDGIKRGLSVSVLSVQDHVAESNMMVSSALIQNNKPVYDDQNRMCSFTTSVHNPFIEERMEDLPQHVVIPLQKQIQRGEMMNNKQFGETVKWNEEYKFLKNIPQLFWQTDRKDIYVGFQAKEKDKPKNMQDPNELQNYNGTYNMVGWNFVKVNRPDGSIRSGIYTIDLFKGQLQRPPINEESMIKTGKTITVVIQEFIYDDSQFRAKTPPTKEKPKPAAEVPNEIDDIDNSPYIPNFKSQYKTKTFQKRMGIDFYIDGLRFLPDKVTVSKVYMQVYNIDYEEIFEKETCLPELDSFSFNPVYNFRRELRKDHIDPTSIVLLTVVTIDKATNETRIVGFAAVPLFITSGPNPIHPQEKNISDVFLFSGAYQLPLISQQVKRTVPFSIHRIFDLERLPCASILVRIVAAPMDEKGLRPLSINDFTDQKIWLEKGLFRPRPLYGKKIYNTSWYKANDAEMDLFPFRALREDISIKEAAYLIIKGKKINKRFKNTELYDYLDENVALTDDNKMMDMVYFAKYSQQAGVKFALDGLHQVPNEGQLYVTFFSINPPFGGFYPYLPSGNESDEDEPEDARNPEFKNYLSRKADLKNYREQQMNEIQQTLRRVQDPQEQQKILQQANQLPPDTSEVNLSSFFLWESVAMSPQYNDQWSTFNKGFNRYHVVVVDVKSISFKKVDPIFEDVGWTIVPLFSHDGYVNSGNFQVPLIKGPVNAQFLYELRRKNKSKYQNENRRDRRQPWELLLEKMNQKRSGLRFLEFTSIICRVLDAQREGHFQVRFDTDRMNYDYLPADKRPKYSYNEAVVIKLKEKKKLSSNIPGKENPANFNKKITDACIQGYNLTRYL